MRQRGRDELDDACYRVLLNQNICRVLLDLLVHQDDKPTIVSLVLWFFDFIHDGWGGNEDRS